MMPEAHYALAYHALLNGSAEGVLENAAQAMTLFQYVGNKEKAELLFYFVIGKDSDAIAHYAAKPLQETP